MERWIGKTAVVSGASQGLGRAVAEHLASLGINVVGVARNKTDMDEVARQNRHLKGKMYSARCDVTCDKSIDECFTWVEKNLGGCDILVNSAGVVKICKMFDMSRPNSDYVSCIDTIMIGYLRMARRAYKSMQHRPHGHIVNVCSVNGHMKVNIDMVSIESNVYQAVKHGVREISEYMRLELGLDPDCRIRITNISPGLLNTEMDLKGGLSMGEDNGRNLRLSDFVATLEPIDIAKQIAYILSCDRHLNITELRVEAWTVPKL